MTNMLSRQLMNTCVFSLQLVSSVELNLNFYRLRILHTRYMESCILRVLIESNLCFPFDLYIVVSVFIPIILSILQPQQQGPRARQPSAPSRQPSTNRQPARTQAEPDEPLSPTSSSQHQMEVAEEARPSKVLEAAGPTTASNGHTAPEVSSQPKPTEEEAMKTEDVPSSSTNENENENKNKDENENSTPKETLMEQRTQDIRGRLRKTRSGTNR